MRIQSQLDLIYIEAVFRYKLRSIGLAIDRHNTRGNYGEQEAAIDWRFAAKLFKEQGNIKKYLSTMKLINQIIDTGSWGSGML